MSEDLIRYDILTQEALRRVIKRVLEEVERAGLPGEHHFFITLDTRFPGVKLSKRMMERYPDEMTIVIQHSFWNLHAGDNAFEIDLSFDDIRERLRVPYDAVRGFFDPAVKFGLQFDAVIAGETRQEDTAADSKPAPATKEAAKKKIDASADEDGNMDEENGAREQEEDGDGAQIVSLDSFRKKK